jgi:FkbM family methyltransferase
MTESAEQYIERILGEPEAAAAQRARNRLSLEGEPIVLYGAGTLGRSVLDRLRRSGLDAAAFADDTPGKQGTSIEGVPVMSPAAAAATFGPQAVFVVTILNPALRFTDARARLRKATGGGRVASFLELAWRFPESFLPHWQFDSPEVLLARRDDIRRAFHAFADEESRLQFAAQVDFRLHLDYDTLPKNSHDDYFPRGVVPPLDDDAVFVDCGAYDGDTVRRFLAEQRGAFGRVYAFEPDAVNFARLQQYVASLAPGVRERIEIHRAGAGERRATLRFNTTGNMSAALSSHGSAEVDIVPLDEIVEPGGARVYVKYDVEGAEWEALRGASSLIRTSRPLMAVSIYHRPDDLWQLPLYLQSLDPGYRLYLRTQGEDGIDVICYCVPV